MEPKTVKKASRAKAVRADLPPQQLTRADRRLIWREELTAAAARAVARGGVNAPAEAQLVIQALLPLANLLVR